MARGSDISFSIQKPDKDIPEQKISDEEMITKWLLTNEIKVCGSAKEIIHHRMYSNINFSDGFKV